MFPSVLCTDSIDYSVQVPERDIRDVKEEFTSSPPASGCASLLIEETFHDLMTAHNKILPATHREAIELFQWFCDNLQE